MNVQPAKTGIQNKSDVHVNVVWRKKHIQWNAKLILKIKYLDKKLQNSRRLRQLKGDLHRKRYNLASAVNNQYDIQNTFYINFV